MRWSCSPLAALLLLGGCVSVYHRPDVTLPDRYAHGPALVAPQAPDAHWWRAFGDPNLDAIVEQALASNRDLATAALNVHKAQLMAGIARLNQGPIASGGVSASRVGNVSAYGASLSVSYEVDLWARLASTTSAAVWEAHATQEDRDATELALIGASVNLYWDIGYTHQQITTGQATLAYQRRILDLVTTQHRLGAVSGVERAEAAQAVTAEIADLSALAQHRDADQAAMALLLGNAPLPVSWEPETLPDGAMADLPVGMPASLLSRRPDVKASEMRLRETLATGDATRAELYPDISLTGGASTASTALTSLLSNPTGSILAAITLPILDYRRHRLNNNIAQANYDIAVLAFKTTLFQALSDADNALSNRTELARQGAALKQSLGAAQTAERLYEVRYTSGSVALRVWLDAQQSARAAQLAYDNNRLSQLVNQSTLYQALGGGGPAT